MKIRKITTTEFNVPDGDYCQRADGSVDCNQFKYDLDPFFGARFYCGAFNNVFHIPFDNKPLCAKRDIKKCEECARMRETAVKRTREDGLHVPRIVTESEYFAGLTYYSAIAYCSACRLPIDKKMSDNEIHARTHLIAVMPNYCPHCGARLKEV